MSLFGSWPQKRRIASGTLLVLGGRLNLWLILLPDGKIEWPVPVPTPRASLSLVPPFPLHPQDKLQPIRNRRLKVLIFQGGRWLVNRLEWRTRAKEMKNEVRFRNHSRSHGVPSSGFLMPVFDVGRCPWTWRFGTHGMGSMQYYFKGSALAHATSPNLWAPRVSTLMSQSAGGLDMVNPGCITAPERILQQFLSLSLSLFHGFWKVIYFYNGFSLVFTAVFISLYTPLIHLQRNINT